MRLDYKTDAEIRALGWEALVEKLGPTGALRFWMMSERGHGDYVSWRHAHLGSWTVADWMREVRRVRNRRKARRS